ncbi:MAG TPA: TRAP transporter substrate-binding protein [Syntrophorhabdaceae bacterium]|nr:TRAP transporter substrate-binding protein [Syntrophorhabdaceae bacterium]
MNHLKTHGIGILFTAFLIINIIIFSAHAQENVINMNYAHFMPTVTKQAQLAEQWCKEVEKRTNGRVKIKFYPGSTLINAPLMYDGVVKGIADIGWSFLAYTRGKFPLSEVVDLPLGYKSGYVATKLANEFYKQFKPKELDDVKVMYLHAHGPGILLTAKKPVHKLEDLKGMKIRATGLSAKIVETLGGAPVGMPISDAYDTLRTGVVEGISVTVEALQQWKLADYIKYVTENYGSAYTTTGFCIMNKKKWNSLPSDIQKIIEDINKEWIEKTGQLWDQLDKEDKVFAENKGIKFISLSKEEDEKWASKVRPILDAYVKSMETKNLPGDKALKFCIDFLNKNQ